MSVILSYRQHDNNILPICQFSRQEESFCAIADKEKKMSSRKQTSDFFAKVLVNGKLEYL